jgi:hypothetical protein
MADGDVRQHNSTWSDGSILLNDYATVLFTEMRYDCCPHLHSRAISDRYQVWTGRLNHGVVSNPHLLPNVHAAPTIEPDARSCRAWRKSGENLKNPISQSWEQFLRHTLPF